MGNMCTQFQFDWTSTSSKTILSNTFNLKLDTSRRDGQTDRPTDSQSEKNNDYRWGINI